LTFYFRWNIFNQVVNNKSRSLVADSHSPSDSMWRAMVHQIVKHERRVSYLAFPYDMFLAAESKLTHLLERANSIHRSGRGRTHICRLNSKRLSRVDKWLS